MTRAVPVPQDFWDPRNPTQPTKEFRTWCELVARMVATINNGGAGAPVDAQYVTLANDATLTNERVLTAGSNITITDGGANSTVTIAASGGASSPLTTKGDIWGYDSADERIPVGADGAVLTADSAQTLGVKWALPGSAGSSIARPFSRVRPSWWFPTGFGTTTGASDNGWSPDMTGNGGYTWASTNLFTSSPALNIVTATLSTSYSRFIQVRPLWWRGNAANIGGFYYSVRFGIHTYVNDMRFMVGLWNSNTHSNANPSTRTHLLVMGCDNSETTFSIMHNDGAGSATKISLGANFPCNTNQTDVYDFELFAAPNASTVDYYVERINTGHTASGTISTDLPGDTQQLYSSLLIAPGTSGSAASCNIMWFYGEVPY